MGNSHASAFLSQFSTVELRESTKKQLWQVYHCTYGKEKEASASAPAAASIGIDSPPASPRGSTGDRSASATNPSSTAASSVVTATTSGEGGGANGPQRKQPQAVVVLQLNTQHPSYRASTMPPKVLNPTDHQSASQYRLQYHMLETSHRALQWLRDHPHRALLRVMHVDYLPEEKALYCTTPYISLEPILLRIPSMCASEILYGLTKIAEALAHLHSNGLAHRNVSWKSIYFAYTLGSLANFPDTSWVLAEPQFTSLAQPHQALSSPDATERYMDYLTELRGVRQDPSSLAYCAPELNNPFVAAQLGWSKVSGSAADVFSFGVMLDMVINNDRTRFPSGGVAFVNPFANAASFGPRPALEEMRRFAKQCQHDDPLQRPAIEHFFDLGLVQGCTYVHIQQFLDHYRTSGWLQRVHFFYLLHAELLKLPYDLMVSRVMPRLLRSSLWNDSCAEPFVRQLLVPVGLSQHTARSAAGARSRSNSGGSSKDEAAKGEPMLLVPLKAHEMKAVGVRPDDPERAAVFGEVNAVLAALEAPETSAAAQRSKVLVPRLPCLGVLQLAEFQSLVGTFLRKTLEGLLLTPPSHPARGSGVSSAPPNHTLSTNPGDDVSAARSGENPYLTCLLLRNIESFAPALSFTQFVLPFLLPFVGQSLEHMEADVVLEALRAFQYLHRHVFSTYDRYVAHNAGRAAYVAQAAAAAQVTASDGVGVVLPPVYAASGSELGEASRDAAMRGTLEVARSRLVAMLNQQIFSRASCDAVPEIRLGALMLATKSLTSAPSKSDRYMPRCLALSAICSNITLSNLPTNPLVAVTQPPRKGCDALVVRDLQVPFVRIALRCVAFVEKVVRLLTPAELVQEMFPSLTILYDRLCTADATPREKELLETLATTALSLMDQILAHLRDGNTNTDGMKAVPSDKGGAAPRLSVLPVPAVASAENEEAGYDEADDEPMTEDGVDPADHGEGRLPLVVDKDGWCVVRDPPPLLVPSLKASWLSVVPRASPPAFRRRSAPRLATGADARANATMNSSKASAPRNKEGDEVPEVGAGDDSASGSLLSGDEPSIGVWTALHIPASCVASLPTFSFLDFDHDYNTLAVVRPDRVAAEVISASSSRAFVCSIKPHVLASRLPSRRGEATADSVEARESLEVSDHSGKSKVPREHKRVALEALDLGGGTSVTSATAPPDKATEVDAPSDLQSSTDVAASAPEIIGDSRCATQAVDGPAHENEIAPPRNFGDAPTAASSISLLPTGDTEVVQEKPSVAGALCVVSPSAPETDHSTAAQHEHGGGGSVANRLRSGSAKAKVGDVTPPPVPRRKSAKAGHGSGPSVVVVDDDL